jgi:tetratricopeptide (TPR) repeat protein
MARDCYEKLLAVKPGLSQVTNNLACLYLERLNDLEKAHTLARAARKLRPAADVSASPNVKMESSAIADTLGWVLYKRKEYAEALDLAREAAQGLAGNAEVQYHLGMAAAMMGSPVEARAALNAALKPPAGAPGGSGLPDGHPARAEIQARLVLLGEENAAGPTLPLRELEAAAGKQPGDALLQYCLGGAYGKEKDYQRAAAAYGKALQLNPGMAVASVDLARLFAGPLHDRKKALELAKSVKHLVPTHPGIAGQLGGIAFDAGDHLWAYDLFSEACRVPNPGATLLTGRAWAAYSLGKVTEAREVMDQLLHAWPDSPEATGAKSFLALSAPTAGPKAMEEASAAGESVLRTDPDNVPALMIRARVQAGKGDTASATATCKTVLGRFPAFAPAQIQLAALYAGDPGTRDQAWQLATAAREVLPGDPELIRVLGELSYHKKDYPYAIQLLQPGASKNALSAESLYYLGMSQWHNDDKTAAQSTLKKALEAGLPKALSEEAQKVFNVANPQ